MDQHIVAIGGAVIKTAWNELKDFVRQGKVEMLIHNGASLFHDFQRATDPFLQKTGQHSYPLKELLVDKELDKPANDLVWNWFRGSPAPEGSVTALCESKQIPVLCFSALGCDFWQLFGGNWQVFAIRAQRDLGKMVLRFKREDFHYLLMGSAVIHPEVFRSALALAQPKNFRADVVDFLDMYRPRTRVACYGTYYRMSFLDFFKSLSNRS